MPMTVEDWQDKYYEQQALHTEAQGMLASERDSWKRKAEELEERLAEALGRNALSGHRAGDETTPTAGGVQFQRSPFREWEVWSANANLPPPTPEEVSGLTRQQGYGGYVVWGGVHFHAIRYPDGREWDAAGGWLDRKENVACPSAGLVEGLKRAMCAYGVRPQNPCTPECGCVAIADAVDLLSRTSQGVES